MSDGLLSGQPLDDPYEVSIAGNSKTGKLISGRFSFRDQQSVDELVGILNAMKLQLQRRDQGARMGDAPGEVRLARAPLKEDER